MCTVLLPPGVNPITVSKYPGADKSLVRPGRRQTPKHVSDARDFNNTETQDVIKYFSAPLKGKAPKEIHAILTETLVFFLPGRAKDLSATCISYASVACGGGFGGLKHPPKKNSEGPPKSCQTEPDHGNC